MTDNAAERAMGPLAVGRKNWLFAGSDTGGERAALMYTIVETAKLNGLTAGHHRTLTKHRTRRDEKGADRTCALSPTARERRRPFRLLLTPGNVHDIKAAPELMDQLEGAKYILGDKGYDSDKLRALIRKQGARPVIPGKANRKRKVPLDKARYKSRHLVENDFCRLKDFRRVATRYDKLALNFLSAVALAVALAVVLAYWV